MKYYIDTCIWIDYFENRCDRFRPLGEWAIRAINKILSGGHNILFSDVVLNELKIKYSEDKIKSLMNVVPKEKLVLVVSSENHWRKAAVLGKKFGIPLNDVVHAMLAKENGAVLVSRDNHFNMLHDFIAVRKPEDLI